MLEKVEWGKFRLGDLFEINSSNKIFHANYLENIFDEQVKNSYPYVVRTTQNNWIRWYIIENEDCLNEKNTLSFAQDTFSVFYQKQQYFTGNKVKILKAKFENKTEFVMKYLTVSFQKSLNTLSWWTGSTIETIGKTEISLPTKNWEIDFDFMETFIEEIEKEKIEKLNNYLEITWLKDYNLTEKEKKVLEDFENEKIEFWEFLLWWDDGLFEIATWRDVIIWKVIDWNIPLISHQHENNWITKKIEKLENRRLFNYRNTLSLADRWVFLATTQNEDFHIWTRVKALKFKDWEKDIRNRLFFVSSINKLQVLFTEYSKNATGNLPNLSIQLPTRNNEPDYELMETLISAIQKLVIKDVVNYTDWKMT